MPAPKICANSRFTPRATTRPKISCRNSLCFRPNALKEPTPIIAEDVVMGGEEDELLTLTSIHQAKGAEWKAVFIIWTAEGKFPSPRALKEFDSEEEERRLWYVALTRAKDELYLTYPQMMIDYSRQTVLQKPSRFILEVPPAMFELWSLEEHTPQFDAPVEIEDKKQEFLN